MDIYNYYYLLGLLFLLPFWLMLFFRKRHRKDMLSLGVFVGVIAVIFSGLYSNVDYWTPVYLISSIPLEEFLYGFLIGGISSELYEYLFGSSKGKKDKHPKRYIFSIVASIALFILFLFCIYVIKINSIYAYIIPLLGAGIIVVSLRRNLLVPELLNGLLVTALTIAMFVFLQLIYPEIFTNHWMLQNLSGYSFLNIPLEELLFAFALGFSAGGVYEFITGEGS